MWLFRKEQGSSLPESSCSKTVFTARCLTVNENTVRRPMQTERELCLAAWPADKCSFESLQSGLDLPDCIDPSGSSFESGVFRCQGERVTALPVVGGFLADGLSWQAEQNLSLICFRSFGCQSGHTSLLHFRPSPKLQA
ncbi:hypothetical protein JZ751_000853 [Albula glossodonta]|uniref:Uncharacterized protein n=1 Tax=Albula glossodonta TaxID=121402 RepID=A0A8T2PX84_9TELE|nr:hypothetical protein JZ751_000853 [Albula glossodonta]